MAGSKKIKASIKQGTKILVPEPIDYDSQPPIFSLEKIQDGKYNFANLNEEHKARFADAIFRRRDVSWRKIKYSDRHALGTEKIDKSALKVALPNFITDDFNDFLSIRYHGKRPMVGYRQTNIFYVLWFDHDFTLYKH